MAGVGEAVDEQERTTAAETFARRRVPRTSRPGGTATKAAAGNGLLASIAQALDNRRLFVLTPFAIILGLIASTAATASPEPLALAGVGAIAVLGLPLLVRSLAAFRLLVLFAAFWTGFSLLSLHGALFGTQMLARAAYGTYAATVDEVLSESDGTLRLLVSGISPIEGARVLPIRRARISIDDAPDLSPGDAIQGKIRFYPVPGPVVPGGFDSQFHGYFDGVGAYASAIGPVTLTSAGDAATGGRLIDSVRRAIGGRIDAVLSQPAAGIARALITGDQTAVAQEARDVMAAAGLAHVLSVSGLHLTIVAGGVFAALRMLLSMSNALARRFSAKRLAAFGGIAAALLYFSISGGNVAALRSTIMIVLIFGAVIFGRRALTMRNVAIAALIVILTDPASVFRPSFQLSFAAVVALIGVWEFTRPKAEKDRGLGRQALGYFLGLAATSLVAGAATLLFSAYHFQQTSPLGVLGNLLSLPLVGFVMMPAAVFAVLAMPFGAESPFLLAMGWSIERMLDLAGFVAGWSGGIDASPLLTPVALFIGLAALGWFAFFQNRWRLLGPALALPAVLLFALDSPPDVLIADTTQAIALRTVDGLRLIAGRPGSFAVDVWQETYGEAILPAAESAVRCDSVGCIALSPAGFTVAVITDPAGFYEDCATADLVVTRRRAPATCNAKAIIDGEDLAAHGVHWLRWDSGRGEFDVRPAITDLNRPWRAARP